MTSIHFPDPFLHAPIESLEEIDETVISELHSCSIHRIGDLASMREGDLLASTQLSLANVLALKEALIERGIVLGKV